MSTPVRLPIALAVGVGLLGIAVVLVLSRSPLTVVAKNMVSSQMPVASLQSASEVCQEGETVRAGTSAIRFFLSGVIGPRLTVVAKAGGRIVARGSRAPGWTGGSVTVPVGRVARTFREVEVCVALGPGAETILLRGAPAPATRGALIERSRQGARMSIDYMRAGRSWWSLLASVSRRMGIGHAWEGSWIALLLVGAMVVVLVISCGLLLRELR